MDTEQPPRMPQAGHSQPPGRPPAQAATVCATAESRRPRGDRWPLAVAGECASARRWGHGAPGGPAGPQRAIPAMPLRAVDTGNRPGAWGRARNPRSPSPSPICPGTGMGVRSPICRGSGIIPVPVPDSYKSGMDPRPRPRFAGDRGSSPSPVRIGDSAPWGPSTPGARPWASPWPASGMALPRRGPTDVTEACKTQRLREENAVWDSFHALEPGDKYSSNVFV
jgi:hypothetical protein